MFRPLTVNLFRTPKPFELQYIFQLLCVCFLVFYNSSGRTVSEGITKYGELKPVCEDVQDKDRWKLENKGKPTNPGEITWKMAAKIVCVLYKSSKL